MRLAHRRGVARREAALGRDVRLGEVRLSLLPSLGLSIDDLGVGALDQEGGGDLITAAGLRVGARLMPLLRGRLEATSVVLEEPASDLEGLVTELRSHCRKYLAPYEVPSRIEVVDGRIVVDQQEGAGT